MGQSKEPSDMKWWQACLVLLLILALAGAAGIAYGLFTGQIR